MTISKMRFAEWDLPTNIWEELLTVIWKSIYSNWKSVRDFPTLFLLTSHLTSRLIYHSQICISECLSHTHILQKEWFQEVSEKQKSEEDSDMVLFVWRHYTCPALLWSWQAVAGGILGFISLSFFRHPGDDKL